MTTTNDHQQVKQALDRIHGILVRLRKVYIGLLYISSCCTNAVEAIRIINQAFGYENLQKTLKVSSVYAIVIDISSALKLGNTNTLRCM